MDLQDYKIKNSAKCDCGYEFTIHDLTELKRINDNKFYGGNIKHISETHCPLCNKDALLLLKQVGQTYKVIDIAQKNKTIKEVNTGTTGHAQISSETINDTDSELICPNCKRVFKTKQGLARHMQSCK